jgi:hypothetical protein
MSFKNLEFLVEPAKKPTPQAVEDGFVDMLTANSVTGDGLPPGFQDAVQQGRFQDASASLAA